MHIRIAGMAPAEEHLAERQAQLSKEAGWKREEISRMETTTDEATCAMRAELLPGMRAEAARLETLAASAFFGENAVLRGQVENTTVVDILIEG